METFNGSIVWKAIFWRLIEGWYSLNHEIIIEGFRLSDPKKTSAMFKNAFIGENSTRIK